MPTVRTPKTPRAADANYLPRTTVQKYEALLNKPATADSSYTEDDLVITSSDNVVFKVPNYYMLAESSVIRDTYAIGTGQYREINLDDQFTETSDTIRLWLDLLTERPPPAVTSGLDYKLRNVLYLARKFDCVQVMSTALLLLGTSPSEAAPFPFFVSVTGAIYGNTDLVASSIKANGERKLHVSTGDNADLAYSAGQASDPSTWSWSEWRLLPAGYAWAMQRAFKQGKTDQERSERFKVLFEKVKAYRAY